MGVIFRNVDASPADDIRTWPYEALVAVIDRGLVADWKPVFAAAAGTDSWVALSCAFPSDGSARAAGTCRAEAR